MQRSWWRTVRPVSNMVARAPHNPIIAVIGTTGAGKSRLAVDLALQFNGEIVNADAVQMYDGLPIITNKITAAERRGIPHHLLGCIGLDEPTWQVGTFVTRALDVIHSIRERGRIPILVGGTHYYTQSLLFHDALAEAGDETHDGSQWPILDATPEEMLEKLQEVDPIMAERWHPNDGRKIRRSLEIYFKTGKRASELYAQQEDRRSNGHLKSVGDLEVDVEEAAGSPEAGLRFPTLFLWTHTPRDVLKERLRGRVDNMVEEGLIREAQDLEASAEKYEAAGKAVDRGRGVYISIGYKELIAYLTAFRNDDSDQTNLEGLRAEAIEDIKSATWRYAKTQERWIRRRLFNALQQDRKAGSLFVLDTADPLRWEANVCNPAAEITRMFLQGETLPENRTMSSHAEEILQPLIGDAAVPTSSARRTRTCDICNVITTTEQEFLLHVNSNRHHKCVRALQKRRLGITPHVGPEDG